MEYPDVNILEYPDVSTLLQNIRAWNATKRYFKIYSQEIFQLIFVKQTQAKNSKRRLADEELRYLEGSDLNIIYQTKLLYIVALRKISIFKETNLALTCSIH